MSWVSVDNSVCGGHGQCEAVAPDVLTLDDDGYSDVGDHKEVPAGQEDEVRDGVDSCPVQALTFHEA